MENQRLRAVFSSIAPRENPDAFVIEYLEEVCSLAAFMDAPDALRAFEVCDSVRFNLQLDLSSLFWSTQSKIHQLNVRLREPNITQEYGRLEEHFLCVKCGTWVSIHNLEQHLPIRELVHFCSANPAHSHLVPDSP